MIYQNIIFIIAVFYQHETIDGDLDFDIDYMSESKSIIFDVLKSYSKVIFKICYDDNMKLDETELFYRSLNNGKY